MLDGVSLGHFLEVVLHDPGTHIYTYLLPGTILAAFGLRTVEEAVAKLFRRPYGHRINLILGIGPVRLPVRAFSFSLC